MFYPAPFGPATDRVKKEKKTDMTGNTIPSTARRGLAAFRAGGSQNWLPPGLRGTVPWSR
jgi:hypothetical protein